MGLIRRQGDQLEADVLHRQAMREGDEEVGPTGEAVRRWNVRTWGPTGEGVRKQEEGLNFSPVVSVSEPGCMGGLSRTSRVPSWYVLGLNY